MADSNTPPNIQNVKAEPKSTPKSQLMPPPMTPEQKEIAIKQLAQLLKDKKVRLVEKRKQTAIRSFPPKLSQNEYVDWEQLVAKTFRGEPHNAIKDDLDVEVKVAAQIVVSVAESMKDQIAKGNTVPNPVPVSAKLTNKVLKSLDKANSSKSRSNSLNGCGCNGLH